MKNRNGLFFVAVLVAVVMLASLSIGFGASAAPAAAPTPVAVNVYPSGSSDWAMASFWPGTALTADGRSTCVESAGFSIADIQYKIDQGTTNTTTLTLQFTNDKVTYTNGVNLVASNAADASDLQPFGLYGRYVCLYADVTNSNAVTVTALGVLK